MSRWSRDALDAPHTQRELDSDAPANPSSDPAIRICRTCATRIGQLHLIPCEAGPGIVQPDHCED